MNPNAKHTPGPWMQGPTANTWHKVYEGKKGEYGGRAICTLHNIHANGARQRGDFETETANARLIAAAPALLEALRLMLDTTRHCDGRPYQSSFDAARAALAQAEGGAQ